MIDMHTHILPGIDDGPTKMEESINIVEMAIREGLEAIVFTPHIREEKDWEKAQKIQDVFCELITECESRKYSINMVLGAEILIIPFLAERLKDNESMIIKGKRQYVLIEFPFGFLPIYTDQVLFDLVAVDVIPIIAHPERYLYLNGKENLLAKWGDNGAMYQLNLGSLYGMYGRKVKSFGKKMLTKGFIDFLGSDTHSLYYNNFSLEKAFHLASKLAKKNYFETGI